MAIMGSPVRLSATSSFSCLWQSQARIEYAAKNISATRSPTRTTSPVSKKRNSPFVYSRNRTSALERSSITTMQTGSPISTPTTAPAVFFPTLPVLDLKYPTASVMGLSITPIASVTVFMILPRYFPSPHLVVSKNLSSSRLTVSRNTPILLKKMMFASSVQTVEIASSIILTA